MQRDEVIVTREDQAKALQDAGFLQHFLTPVSPSDVARHMGMPANLAHHHAKRHADLGLLVEVQREAGKVLYQLAARTFKHGRSLISTQDANHPVQTGLSSLSEHFLQAYERSNRIADDGDPDWTVYSFGPEPHENKNLERDQEAQEARPAHFQVRVLRLSAQRYSEIVNSVWRLLEHTASDESGGECTLSFLAMDGTMNVGQNDAHAISSFVPQKP